MSNSVDHLTSVIVELIAQQLGHRSAVPSKHAHGPCQCSAMSTVVKDPFCHVAIRLRLLVSTYQRPSGSSLNRSRYPPKISKAPCTLPETTHGVTIFGLTACLSCPCAPGEPRPEFLCAVSQADGRPDDLLPPPWCANSCTHALGCINLRSLLQNDPRRVLEHML